MSYTNSRPFVYGLEHSDIMDSIDLSLDIPSDCARKLIDDKADVGLVPVAALLDIPDYEIISDYCIGAVAAVNSVFIFSNKPAEQIRSVRRDVQSRTSNQLAKVLFKHHWKTQPEFIDRIETDAFVEIGDRTFGKKDKFPYVYDLAEEWISFTGLPFVFAAWAANKELPGDFINKFNSALKYGLDHRKEVIKELPQRDDFDLDDYLMNHIDFSLDSRKKQGLNRFLDLIRTQ